MNISIKLYSINYNYSNDNRINYKLTSNYGCINYRLQSQRKSKSKVKESQTQQTSRFGAISAERKLAGPRGATARGVPGRERGGELEVTSWKLAAGHSWTCNFGSWKLC